MRQAREYQHEGKRWVVDLDLEKFFDFVNYDILLARVRRRVQDPLLLPLISRYLRAGMMENGVETTRTQGTPQGGPLSPLLSHILLDDFDKELERRGHKFVRYAADANIYVASKAGGERVAPESVKGLKGKVREHIRRGRGRKLKRFVEEDLNPVLRGWSS